MNQTPHANRKLIGLFGKTNSGKSSLLNALVGQQVAIVSEHKGTTTDPVFKTMELLPVGPVLFADTAGLDDHEGIGALRMAKSRELLTRTDLALLVVDAREADNSFIKETTAHFSRYNLPYLLLFNQCDRLSVAEVEELQKEYPDGSFLSAHRPETLLPLKQRIAEQLNQEPQEPSLIGGLVQRGGMVVLVTPIDSEAPKGRLILPQVQLIRDCLDHGLRCMVVREGELEQTLEELPRVDLVVTDSQLFPLVHRIVAGRFPLTGFSILFARQKGDLPTLLHGAAHIDRLPAQARILIAESCTHNTTHEDIGRVKLPNLLRKRLGEGISIEFVGGKDFPNDLTPYHLILHCGGCMITRRHMQLRIDEATRQGVPITNYGLALAHFAGILEASSEWLIPSL